MALIKVLASIPLGELAGAAFDSDPKPRTQMGRISFTIFSPERCARTANKVDASPRRRSAYGSLLQHTDEPSSDFNLLPKFTRVHNGKLSNFLALGVLERK